MTIEEKEKFHELIDEYSKEKREYVRKNYNIDNIEKYISEARDKKDYDLLEYLMDAKSFRYNIIENNDTLDMICIHASDIYPYYNRWINVFTKQALLENFDYKKLYEAAVGSMTPMQMQLFFESILENYTDCFDENFCLKE